jgi:hypothetical protein
VALANARAMSEYIRPGIYIYIIKIYNTKSISIGPL